MSNFFISFILGDNLQDHVSVPNLQRVQFKTQICSEKSETGAKKSVSKERRSIPNFDQSPASSCLKRSKSLTAADALKYLEMEANFSKCSVSFSEYHIFPKESHVVMKQAVESNITIFMMFIFA